MGREANLKSEFRDDEAVSAFSPWPALASSLTVLPSFQQGGTVTAISHQMARGAGSHGLRCLASQVGKGPIL
jgi:hypothetical protein